MVAYIGQSFYKMMNWEAKDPGSFVSVGLALASTTAITSIFIAYKCLKFVTDNRFARRAAELRQQERDAQWASAVMGFATGICTVTIIAFKILSKVL